MFDTLTLNPTINPFFAGRMAYERPRVYAKLPVAPLNASPVPHLTSLYHDDEAGDYGDRSYPGNCGGNLIRDLLKFYQPRNVFDPMSGSGTCRDVCRELDIDCWSGDLRRDFDLCNSEHFYGAAKLFDRRSFDFVWIHPPYWRQKIYSQDARDLSQAKTLDEFLEKYQAVIAHCMYVLRVGGTLAVLMGDYLDRDHGFAPLVYHTKRLAFECGLKQCATDIIRFSHGASSSKKVYKSSFNPGLHDVCMLFTKGEPLTGPERTL